MTLPNLAWLLQWEAEYDGAVHRENAPDDYGVVKDVHASIGRFGGLRIEVEFTDGRRLSPYYNSAPFDGCTDQCGTDELCQGHELEADETAFLDSMLGATEWSEWEWVEVTPGEAF